MDLLTKYTVSKEHNSLDVMSKTGLKSQQQIEYSTSPTIHKLKA